jgi:N6-adenosine-specific RNA methylase IME4
MLPHIDSHYQSLVPPLSEEERNALKEYIKKTGFKVDIITNAQGVILDGHTRFQICQELGIKPTFTVKEFQNKLEEEEFVIKNLIARRNINHFVRAELALKLEPIEAKLAKMRQVAGTLASTEAKGKTSEKLAKKVHTSKANIERVKKILEVAPEKIIKKAREGSISVSRAYQIIIINENKKLPKLKLPPGEYNLVIWDPSWPHDNEVAGGSGTSGNAQKYRPETIEELKSKGLQDVLAKDAILGIWTLPTFHAETLDVIKSNGFEKIKTKIYWDKMAPSMGYNFRNQVEELCICVRGNVKAFWQKNQPNIIHQKASRPHSRKPDIFFEIMEKAAAAGLPGHKISKLEINATIPRRGWVTIGNQMKKKDDLQEKCRCNHTRICHNDDHKTGQRNTGFCAYELVSCGCKRFTPKKTRRMITV